MTIKWLFMSIAIQTVFLCSPGCLQCGPNAQCTICDPTLMRVLKNGECVPANIPGCQLINSGGKCIACQDPYYFLDSTNNKCVSLNIDQMVLFCAQHSGPNNCTACEVNFYLDSGECKFSPFPVPFCQVQSGPSTCQKCKPLHYLSNSGSECIPITLQSNCLEYSTNRCTQCSDGYIFNPNLYLSSYSSVSAASSIDQFVSQTNSIAATPFVSPPAVCQPAPSVNCATISETGSCNACQSGYYLAANKTCVMIPVNSPFCSRFLFSNYCIECIQGYILTNKNGCVPVTPVPNCNAYNTTTNRTICVSCMPGMYPVNETTCSPRQNLDLNCITYTTNFDNCNTCFEGFILNYNKTNCLQGIANCLTYVDLNVANSSQLACQTCTNNTYRDSTTKKCLAGNLTNCTVYVDDSPTQCKTCANGYYNLNNTCLASRRMPNCQNYSQTDRNRCDQCDSTTILVSVVSSCQPVTAISNCAVYASVSTCKVCALGYYLTSGFMCTAIPSNLNCLNYTGSLCLECKPNYVLTTFGTCRSALSVFTNGCNSTNITGALSSFNEGCKTCAAGSVPVDYYQWYYCVENWYLPIAVQNVLDQNCQNWRLDVDQTVYKCMKCKTGYFLATDTSCAVGCTANGLTTIYTYHLPTKPSVNLLNFNTFVNVNRCGTTITGCAYATEIIPQTTTSTQYVCTKCVSGKGTWINLSDSTMALFPAPTTYLPIPTPATLVSKLKCLNENDKNFAYIYSNTTVLTPNCDYFYDLPIQTSVTGCLKCKFGYTGRVVDYIANCYEYDGLTCKICRPFNYPATPTVCQKVWRIPHCKAFDQSYKLPSCTVCDNGWYLKNYVAPVDTNTKFCEKSTVDPGCSIYSQTVDACSTCLSTYYMISGACYLLPTNCVAMVLNGGNAKCSVCDNTVSYLDNVTPCALGTIAFCKTYDASSNTCVTCNNGYYLSSATSCTVHPADPKCVTFSQTTSGLCDVCSFDSFKFAVVNTCTQITTITSCSSYYSPTLCAKCVAGTQLNSAQTACSAISSGLNCQDYAPLDLNADGTISSADQITGDVFLYSCNTCSTNYMRKATLTSYTLASGGTGSANVYTCVSYFNFVMQNCNVNSNDGTVIYPNVRCKSGCSSNYLPIDWTGRNMCIEDSYLTSLSATVTNCLVYAWSSSASNYVCSICSNGYFLDVNACVSTCSGSKVLYLWQVTYDTAKSQQYAKITGKNVCSTISQTEIDSDCGSVAPTYLSLLQKYACLSCKTSTKLALVDFALKSNLTTVVDFNSYSTSPTTKTSSPLIAYPSVSKCFDLTVQGTSLGTTIANGLVDNCLYYGDFTYSTTSQFGCIRCKFGYTGKIIQDTNSDKGYVQSCTADSSCDTNTFYTGLQGSRELTQAFGSIYALFSCHKCTSSNAIPVAFVEISYEFYQVSKLRAYKIPNTSGVSLSIGATGSEGNALACLDPSTASNLGLTAITNVANCALIVVNVVGSLDGSGLAGSDFAKMNAFCVACKPGYAPTYSTQINFGFIITTCTTITNCPSNKGVWLNSCSTCPVFGMLATTNLIDYSTCTSNTISNCFVGTDTDCKACRNGYTLSSSNTCISLSAPYCTTNNVFKNDYLSLVSSTELGYLTDSSQTPFYINEILTGCTSCSGTASTSLVNLDQKDQNMRLQACVSTSTLYATNTSPFATSNCLYYGFSDTGSIKCLTCANSYVIADDYTCVSDTNYPNCILVSATTNKCLTCTSSSYIFVNNVCTANNPSNIITNCVALTTASATSTATCQTCDSYYVPDATRTSCVAFTQANFPNCLQIDITQSYCTACAANFVLVFVASGWYCYPIGLQSSNAQPDHDGNCLTFDAGVSSTNSFQFYKLTCTSCKTGYIATTSNTYVNYCYPFQLASAITPQCNKFYTTQPQMSSFNFKCIGCSNVPTYYFVESSNSCATRTNVNNCQTYDPNADICTTCNSGYLGSGTLNCYMPYVPKNVLPNNRGYIEDCTVMSSCDATAYYGGLSSTLEKIFSCHRCTAANSIPFAYVSGQNPYLTFDSLKEYGTSPMSPPSYFSGNVNGTAIVCQQPTAAALSLPPSKFAFPTNCGLGFVNVDADYDATDSTKATNVDLTKIAAFCVACSPKYMPATGTDSSNVVVRLFISSCTEIPNCATSTTFNSCDMCANGYSLLYVSGTGISTTNCVQYTVNPNCLATVSTNGPCQMCKIGYYLNRDGICEILNAASCTSVTAGLGTNTIELQYMLVWNSLSGCISCQSGFWSVFSQKHQTYCTVSPYIVVQNPASQNYVPYCAVYSNEIVFGNLICAACNNGYILTTASRCVQLSSTLSNCFVAFDASRCAICTSNYANVDYVCMAPTITNCQTYYPMSIGFQQCLFCQPTYYLQDNQCFQGKITGCQIYQGYNQCLLCQPGYMLTTLRGYVTKCLFVPLQNCLYFQPDQFLNNVFNCSVCSANNIPVDLPATQSYSSCYDFQKTQNCILFDVNPEIGNSTFNCRGCVDKHFLDWKLGVCFPRMFSYENCEIRNPLADVCTKCAKSYQLDESRTSCVLAPQTRNCAQTDSTGTCILCPTGFYLNSTQCLAVDSTKLISNCLRYDANQQCYSCLPGYFFQNGICSFTYATNCATYLDAKTCLTCNPGFGIKTDNGISNCVFKNVMNCVQSTNTYPFMCLVCTTGYYADRNGSCIRILKPIDNCQYYGSNGLCATCFSGYVRSADSLSCAYRGNLNLTIEQSCQSIETSNNGFCITCADGYYFQNGQCVQCYNGTLGACRTCNPFDPSGCLVCNFGYYQATNMSCYLSNLQTSESRLRAAVEVGTLWNSRTMSIWCTVLMAFTMLT